VAGLAVALVLGVMIQAQEPRRDGRAPSILPPGIERLELSGEQREKVAKLEKEFQGKLETAKKKLDEALEQARQNQDRAKAQEAQEAFRKEVTQLQEAAQSQLGQVLNEEQKRRLAELQRAQPGRPGFDLPRILGQLDLAAEQRDKIEKLMREFGEKREAAEKKLKEALEQARQNQDREKFRELTQAHEKETAKAHEELQGKVQEVLNEEQKRRFAELQRQRPAFPPFPGIGQLVPAPFQDRLGLTPEQKEKLAKLQKESEEKLRGILNEEQNQRFEELKKGGGLPERPRPRD
jgi:hypothetical protein